MLTRCCGAIVSLVALSSIGAESTAVAQMRLLPARQIAPPSPAPGAQPQPAEPPSSPSFIVPKQERPLFPNQFPRQLRAQAAEANTPKVVCGMTVIPVNPKLDPKFVIPPPDTGTKYTMRVVPPAICR